MLLALLTWAPSPVPAQSVTGIIDVHVHTSPSLFNQLSDVLASTGITRFINLSGGSTPGKLAKSAEAALQLDGRGAFCVNLAWREITRADFVQRQIALLQLGARLGARCLKISKALGLGVPDPKNMERYLAVDTPLLDPIWREAGKLGLPVFIHTGDPKAFFEPSGHHNERHDELSVHPEWSFADPSYPRREELLAARDRVLAKHRDTIFVGVHFANNPEDLGYVGRALAAHPNLFVDIAARLPEIGRHPPEKVAELFVRFQDRILFGTDLGFNRGGIMLGSVGRDRPDLLDLFWFYAVHFRFFETTDRQFRHPTPIQGRWAIDAINLPQSALEKIYRSNAIKLFWPDAPGDAMDRDVLRTAPGLAAYLR